MLGARKWQFYDVLRKKCNDIIKQPLFYLVLVYLQPLLYNYVLKEFLLLCL